VLDLNAVVAHMDKILASFIGEDIELLTVLEANLGHVMADPGRMEQVIMNLAANARDAMPRGGKLTIETANVDLDENYAARYASVPPGPYVMLAVSDAGLGMDKETLSRLSEPFFTTKDVGKGTGLGLSTVYGIVKQSGGDIRVYSERGRGTTFKIFLPRIEQAVAEAGTEEVSTKTLTGSETVLVVEDEESVRTLICLILRRKGYTVLEAPGGGDALELCRKHGGTIHLVITDVVMPRLSGPELAGKLAGLRPDVKVLYVSGYTERASLRVGVVEPGAAFLQKPFAAGALARKVREILDGTPQRA
jgi:CheY-like chemotaxis protein